ncbi:MAG: hypothetical protein M3Z25_11590 [Actinomycetota bacterium]|nr:hypothetical protein [Actinomycetota bacterium]
MHRQKWVAVVAMGSALAVSVIACGKSAAPPAAPAAAPTSSAAPAPPTETPFAKAPPMTEQVDFAKQLENFEAAKFSDPTKISNTFLPYPVGTQLTYEGTAISEDEGTIKRRFVQTVTDLTKPIMGVRTVVVWDQDFDNDQLKESELAFFGQADNGDVWYFGEYPESYENGRLAETPTWIAGIAGAHPGIAMKATAELGSPSYSQGFSPVVPWTDRSRLSQVGVKDCVPQGCNSNMIVIDEFNREEPGAIQQKYYAPGVGNTRTNSMGTNNEKLQLVKVTQLDPAGLDAARAEALKLDASGLAHSREVYAPSTPIEKPAGK